MYLKLEALGAFKFKSEAEYWLTPSEIQQSVRSTGLVDMFLITSR